MQKFTHTHKHKYTNTHTHTHKYTNTHTNTNTHTHTHTHKHTQIHTHKGPCIKEAVTHLVKRAVTVGRLQPHAKVRPSARVPTQIQRFVLQLERRQTRGKMKEMRKQHSVSTEAHTKACGERARERERDSHTHARKHTHHVLEDIEVLLAMGVVSAKPVLVLVCLFDPKLLWYLHACVYG